MRSDMAKVVTEKPRVGHALRSIKTGLRLRAKDLHAHGDLWADDYEPYDSGLDFGRTRIKVSRLGQCRDRKNLGCHKEFTDVLSPLRGYLKKQVGRPWNDIYSEMNEHLDKRTMTGRHIWTHVWQDVELHVEIGDDGKFYQRHEFGGGRRYPVQGLYVHPETGILCDTQPDRRQYFWTSGNWNRPRDPQTRFAIRTTHILERLWDATTKHWLWFLEVHQALDPEEIVKFVERSDGQVVPIRRKDLKGAVMTQRLSRRQLGRKDRALIHLGQRLAAGGTVSRSVTRKFDAAARKDVPLWAI